jgi:prevent-host-death family protein
MSARVSIAEAKAKLAALVGRAEAGEEIILTRHGRPAARLVPLGRAPIIFGDLEGIYVADDLSLPDDVIRSFEETKLP